MTSAPGRRLEQIIALLERVLADDKKIQIEHGKKLQDRDTGRWREHDVVISRLDHHGTLLTALECKDRRRPVGVPDVEAFAKKLEKTGVHRGIIVSSTGFTNTARIKGAANNIICVDFAEAESFDWFQSMPIRPYYLHYFSYVGFWIGFDVQPIEPLTVFDSIGEPLGPDRLKEILRKLLPEEVFRTPNHAPELNQVVVGETGIYTTDGEGNQLQAAEVIIEYKLVVTELAPRWELRKYQGLESARDVAVGELSLPGIDARLVVTPDEDRLSLRIGFSKHRHES